MIQDIKPRVNTKHPQYLTALDRWTLVRSVINSNVEQYLINPDPQDPLRWKKYKEQAQFTNFTNRTKAGLIGSAFRKDPEANIPLELQYLLLDCDGKGTPLKQLAQKSTGEALEVGRDGLLVDYPPSPADLSLDQVRSLGLQPAIHRYSSEAIINWATERRGTRTLYTLIVLKEDVETLKNEFEWSIVTQYRVLRLINGVYTQSVYNEDGDKIEDDVIPTKGDGSPWEYIPFTFIGSVNNDADIDNAPLYDLARLNIGHYRNSADYEESVWVNGQPTLVLSSSMGQAQWDIAHPDGLKIGSRGAIFLGADGNAQLLQANPNTLADSAMKRKEEQAVMIGARLITPSAGIETAEAARIRNASENSSLTTIVRNVSAAYEKALGFCAIFLNIPDSNMEYRINEEFYEAGIDPNELIAYMQMLDRGVVAMKDFRSRIRDAGLVDPNRTDEAIDAEAERAENPMPAEIQPK